MLSCCVMGHKGPSWWVGGWNLRIHYMCQVIFKGSKVKWKMKHFRRQPCVTSVCWVWSVCVKQHWHCAFHTKMLPLLYDWRLLGIQKCVSQLCIINSSANNEFTNKCLITPTHAHLCAWVNTSQWPWVTLDWNHWHSQVHQASGKNSGKINRNLYPRKTQQINHSDWSYPLNYMSPDVHWCEQFGWCVNKVVLKAGYNIHNDRC